MWRVSDFAASRVVIKPKRACSAATVWSRVSVVACPRLPQVVAVATLLGFVLPLTYGLNLALNRFMPLRAAAEGERQGLDLHELGAYPEFLTHTEEFLQR